jgi:hypothetical protein
MCRDCQVDATVVVKLMVDDGVMPELRKYFNSK